MALSLERLRSTLDYNRKTGVFTYKIARGSKKKGVIAGTTSKGGYREIGIDGKKYRAHRLAWFYVTGNWPVMLIDHRDCDPSNNAFDNLREANYRQSSGNRRAMKKGTSGFKGATFHSGVGKYQSQLKYAGKNHYLGLFETPEEANAAYAAKAECLFQEFARAA